MSLVDAIHNLLRRVKDPGLGLLLYRPLSSNLVFFPSLRNHMHRRTIQVEKRAINY